MPKASNILAFAASNSAASINKRLALHAAEVLRAEAVGAVEVTTLDLNDYEMPIYSPEREVAGIPQPAHDFLAQLGAVDGIILSLAEHNGTYSAAFKNLFDWTSRIQMKVFQDKPMVLLATSMGGGGAQHVLAAALGGFPFFGARVMSSFKFGPFPEHFGEVGLTTPALQAELKEAIAAFAAELPATP